MEISVDSLKGRKANPSLQESIRTINRFTDFNTETTKNNFGHIFLKECPRRR